MFEKFTTCMFIVLSHKIHAHKLVSSTINVGFKATGSVVANRDYRNQTGQTNLSTGTTCLSAFDYKFAYNWYLGQWKQGHIRFIGPWWKQCFSNFSG